jgi:hypothetical protein
MKALSLLQPWATLVAIEAKKIETRSWNTAYRGPLAIHASLSKRFVSMRSPDYVCGEEPFCSILTEEARRIVHVYPHPLESAKRILPRGAVIATCELVDVQPTIAISDSVDWKEIRFGDFTPGRFAWFLNNIKMLPEPVPARGALGLWEWKGGE